MEALIGLGLGKIHALHKSHFGEWTPIVVIVVDVMRSWHRIPKRAIVQGSPSVGSSPTFDHKCRRGVS